MATRRQYQDLNEALAHSSWDYIPSGYGFQCRCLRTFATRASLDRHMGGFPDVVTIGRVIRLGRDVAQVRLATGDVRPAGVRFPMGARVELTIRAGVVVMARAI